MKKGKKPKKLPMRVSAEARTAAKVKRLEGRWQHIFDKSMRMFSPAQHPPGVKDSISPGMAMDDNADLGSWGKWGARGIESSMLLEGQAFPGYQVLALMAQRTENRAIVNILSTEMTRKGWRIKSKGKDKSKADRIAKIEDRFRDLGVQDHFKKCAEGDGFFGRGHLFLQFQNGAWDDKEEIQTSVGDGRDVASEEKVNKNNPLIAIKYIEAVWTYPINYNTTNPLRDDWFRPTTWQVMGTSIHATRLLRFVMNEVPDLLKPAYSFGGLSMTQMARPYVDYWLKTRSSIADLVRSFTVRVISTNLKTTLQAVDGSGEDTLYDRAELLTDMESNNGVVMLDKDTEEFNQISAPLGGLHELQAQSQEHMSLPGRIPTVKLSGISPTGLNASSDGELEAFDDTISSMQNALFKIPLRTILGFVQLSLFDEVDDDIDIEFVPLVEERPLAKAQRHLAEAQYHQTYVEMGAVSGQEVRQVLSEDPDSPYPGLEDGGDPAGGPDDPWSNLPKILGGSGGGWEQLPKVMDPWERLPDAFGVTNKNDWSEQLAAAFDHSVTFDQVVGLFEFMGMDDTEFESKHPRADGGKFAAVASVHVKGEPNAGAPHEMHDPHGYSTKKSAFAKSLGAKQKGPYYNLVQHMLGKIGGLTSATKLTEASGGSPNVKAMLQNMGHLGKFLEAGGGSHGLQLVKGKGPGGEAHYGFREWGKKLAPKVETVEAEAKPSGVAATTWNALKQSGYEHTGKSGDSNYFTHPEKGDITTHSDGSWYSKKGDNPANVGDTEELQEFLDSSGASEKSSSSFTPSKVNMEKVGEQLGTNPGGTYEDENGNKAYVKFYKNPQQGRSEALAAKIYEQAGLKSLNPEILEVNGKEGVVSEWNNGLKKFDIEMGQASPMMMGKLYAAAVVLNDWDVLGVGEDNVKFHALGLYQTDAGGAFKFRAQGDTKKYDADVDSFNLSGNKWTLFGPLMDNEKFKIGVSNALYQMSKVSADTFEESGVDDATGLSSTFKKRISNLKAKFGDPSGSPSKPPSAPESLNNSGKDYVTHLTKASSAASSLLEASPNIPIDFKKSLSSFKDSYNKISSGTKDILTNQQVKTFWFCSKVNAYANASEAQTQAKEAGLKEKNKAAYSILHKATQSKLAEAKSAQSDAAEPAEKIEKTAPKPSLLPPDLEKKLKSKDFVSYIAKHGEKDARALVAMGSEGTAPGAAEDYADKAKDHGHDMTGSQAWALKSYTDSGYGVNQWIRKGATTASQFVFLKKLNEALDVLPKHEGVVYRRASLSPDTLAKYQPGMVVEEHSFTSAAKKKGVWSGDVHYTIKSTSARDVQWMSSHKNEHEVVFKSDTRFLVTNVKKEGGNTHIEMEDMSDYDF